MDFKLSEQDEEFRSQISSFVEEELPWNWRERSIDSEEPSDAPLVKEFRRKLADKGWLTMAWPEEYGGQDAPHIRQMIFNEEMAYRGVPATDAGIRMVGPILMLYGTDEQKQEFLPRIANADIDWAQLDGVGALGVTAGASAPEVLVEEVIAACRERYDVVMEAVAVTSENVQFKLPRALSEATATA